MTAYRVLSVAHVDWLIYKTFYTLVNISLYDSRSILLTLTHCLLSPVSCLVSCSCIWLACYAVQSPARILSDVTSRTLWCMSKHQDVASYPAGPDSRVPISSSPFLLYSIHSILPSDSQKVCIHIYILYIYRDTPKEPRASKRHKLFNIRYPASTSASFELLRRTYHNPRACLVDLKSRVLGSAWPFS